MRPAGQPFAPEARKSGQRVAFLAGLALLKNESGRGFTDWLHGLMMRCYQ